MYSFDKFCGTYRSILAGWFGDKVQCHAETSQGGRGRPDLVEIPLQSLLLPKIPNMAIELDASNMGWRARQGGQQTGGGDPKR